MNKVRLFLLAVFPVLGICALHAQQSFDFPDFSSVSAIVRNRGAARAMPLPPETAPVLRVIDRNGNHGRVGSAWYRNLVPVAGGFTVDFSFNLNNCVRTGCADGFAFVIQNAAAGTAAIGGFGGYLGYGAAFVSPGIENSLAVEFDDNFNPGFGDPLGGDHVAVQSCGTLPNTVKHHTACKLSMAGNLPVKLADGANHTVEIAYLAGNLYTSLDDQVISTTSVDLNTLLSLNNGSAYIGFTSGVAAGGENSDILNWSFSTRYTAFGSLVSSANPSSFGDPVTFTVTMASRYPGLSTPSGQVQLFDGVTSLGTTTLASGQASFTTFGLTVGNHTMRASYSGDSVFTPGSLVALMQVVQ